MRVYLTVGVDGMCGGEMCDDGDEEVDSSPPPPQQQSQSRPTDGLTDGTLI